MKKPSVGLIILSSIGIIAGSFVVRIFMAPNTGHVPGYIGMLYIILNIGLLFLQNWARKTLLIISWLFVGMCVISLPFAGQSAIGIMLMSPLLLYGVIAVIYLMRSKVRELFIK